MYWTPPLFYIRLTKDVAKNIRIYIDRTFQIVIDRRFAQFKINLDDLDRSTRFWKHCRELSLAWITISHYLNELAK